MTKKQIAAQIGEKKEFLMLREYLQTSTPFYLCFCSIRGRMQFCNDSKDVSYCIHKKDEATNWFNQWLDGEITKQQLVTLLFEKEVNH